MFLGSSMHRRSPLLALALLGALVLSGCGGGDATGGQPGDPSPGTGGTGGTGSATLQWSSPGDARIQGYRVYYGTGSRSYFQPKGSGVDTGATTRFVLSDLEVGRTYYFSVTAYDAARNESDYSVEVTKVVN
jgi:hypothetical protein